MRRSIALAVVVGILLTTIFAIPVAAEPAEPPTTTTTVLGERPSPGFFDIQGRVSNAIDGWFGNLVTSAMNPALDLLGRSLLASPDPTQQGQVRQIWMISLGIADSFFILLAIIGGFVVMTYETVQTRYSVKEIAPRLVLAVIAANASLLVASNAVSLANALSRAFMGSGVDTNSITGSLGLIVGAVIGHNGFIVLLAVVATTLALGLVITYLVRAACVVILVALAPIALAFHVLPQTERIAVMWWKSVAACLGVQVAQAFVLITAVRVFFAGNGSDVLGLTPGDALVDLLVMICLFWIMLRIPSWAGRMVFGSNNPATVVKQRVIMAAKAVTAA